MRTFLILMVLATTGLLVMACAADVIDTGDAGKWSDVAGGGDVSKLHDPGAFCTTWKPSDLPPAPTCYDQTHSTCESWVLHAVPPHYPINFAQCETDHGVCFVDGANGVGIPRCKPGAMGDAYCSAWAEAWALPGANVHGVCANNSEPFSRGFCVFGSCDPQDPHYDNPGSKLCDALDMCMIKKDGSWVCELPCSDP